MTRVALYLRVSTQDQTTDNQLLELQAVATRLNWQIVATFTDHGISGAKGRDKRPGLHAMLTGVTRREFDLVASWSVDRLGRSLQDLVGILAEFHARNVGLYLHQQGLDTTTPAGKAMFQMMGVFAEFERAMIRERVMAGLARARKQGIRLGRPRTPHATILRIRAMRSDGTGMLAIARTLGVGTSVVQRVCAGAPLT